MKPYYQKDGIVLYHGDCRKILSRLPKESCHLVLTDPPFGVDYQSGSRIKSYPKIANDVGFYSYQAWATEAYRLLKNDSALFAYTHWREYPHHFTEVAECGFLMQEPLIVQKPPSALGELHGTFKSNGDWILYGWKGKVRFRETMAKHRYHQAMRYGKSGRTAPKGKRFNSCWFGPEYPMSRLVWSKTDGWKHPTVKNIQCLQWLIELTTDPGNMVLEPFAGSGTTLAAAMLTHRKAVGVELEEKYCEMTARRLEITHKNMAASCGF